MIDHLSITVADLDRSTQFYGAVMAALGYPDSNRIEAVCHVRPDGESAS